MNTALAWLTALMVCGAVVVKVVFGVIIGMAALTAALTITAIGLFVNWLRKEEA